MMPRSIRDKSIVCGLFLSKFDLEGLGALGFASFREAFNVFGLALGAKPASIKNYRDELDPLFPNARQGWHKRPLRSHCRDIYERYADWDMPSLAALVMKVANAGGIMTERDADLSRTVSHDSDSFARRLMTGRAAERYFMEHFGEESVFSSAEVLDMTQSGCGFDFRLQTPGRSDFLAVEVKGMRMERGNIALTSKEHVVANELRTRYFLYIVKNFEERPFGLNICNPLSGDIRFNRVERQVIQVTWSANL